LSEFQATTKGVILSSESEKNASEISKHNAVQRDDSRPDVKKVGTGASADQAKRPRVMLVEDSAVDMELLSALLAHMDCDIVVDDGTGAWNIINTHKCPELILLDLVLPGTSGLRLLEHIRSKRAWKNVPVLVVSGDAHPATVHHVAELGVAGFLVKPFEPERVKRELSRFLPIRKDDSPAQSGNAVDVEIV
jgi:two-component system chemotaxis response regulator CheY